MDQSPVLLATIGIQISPYDPVIRWIGTNPKKQNNKIAIAVSGGVDSLFLLSQYKNNPQVTALHVNHGQREASNIEEKLVRSWCEQLNMPCAILNISCGTGADHGTLRYHRYQQLITWCHANDCDQLLLGQHLDDNIETFYLMAERGSGLDGLSGIKEHSHLWGINIIRPLLKITRSDIIYNARKIALRWIEDPSNANPNYRRSQIRQALQQGHHVHTSINALQALRHYFDEKVQLFINQKAIFNALDYIIIPAQDFNNLDNEIARRVLKQIIRVISGNFTDPRFARLDRARTILQQNINPKKITLGGCIIEKNNDKIIVYREYVAINNHAIPANQPVLWDNRFFCHYSGDHAEKMFWQPLGAEGMRYLRKFHTDVAKNIPYHIGITLPSLWLNKP